ncbi:hypothetical protein V2W30_10475 [Streptomyces sp. Q6]|uniref:Uncharacterized protein n=1 Tax=Streptomyces citrinus TaxID=3118173 RepID=A0ACD5ACX4_9ACTN
MKRAAVLAALAPLLPLLCAAAPTPAPPRWPAPTNVAERVRAAGLTMLPEEGVVMHIHSRLTVYADGQQVTVPADLGIDRSGEKPRYSPLHTHDTTGVVHVESPRWQDFTVGQLLTEWGVRPHCAGVVDGRAVPGDPARIVFRDGSRITLRCR